MIAAYVGSETSSRFAALGALTSLNSPDALLGQRLVANKELLVLASEDVVGDGGWGLARRESCSFRPL